MKEGYIRAITDRSDKIILPFISKEIINEKLHNYYISIEKLITDVNDYIKILERYDYNMISAQRERKLNSSETDSFFRKFERNQYNVWILQYLTSFITKIPLEMDIASEIVDPFKQFKTFVLFNVKLLTQRDVIESILEDLRECGILTDKNLVNCRLWIYKKSKDLSELVLSTNRPAIQDWKKLFTALKHLCLFWFSIRDQELDMIRKADIYIYILTRTLTKL